MWLGCLLSGCIVRPEEQDCSLSKFSAPVPMTIENLTGDSFVSHNDLILSAINGLYVL